MKKKNKYDLKHKVDLAPKERMLLRDITTKGKHSVRVVKRAQVLLKSDNGWIDADIAPVVGVSVRTVESIRARYAEGGTLRALYDAPRPGQPLKLDDKGEAYLVALACTSAPEGYERWTLELLLSHLKKDKRLTKPVTTVCLWKRLTTRGIKPWLEKNVGAPQD
jgi:transposase